MLKVIQFIHGLNMGGAETLVKDYALGFDKSEIDLIILCYERYNSPYEKILKDAGINVIYICDEMPLFERREIWARVINKFMLFLKIRKYIHKIDPDIIHEHLILNSYLKFARPGKKTIIFYTQHFQVKRWIEHYSKEVKALKWLMKHYKVCFIALNNLMKKELDEYFHIESTVILKNGINLDKFRSVLPGTEMREKLGISKGAFVIGHVGRFSEIKNHEFLVDVFAEIVKKNENTFLLMIGKGETMKAVQRKLKNFKLDNKAMIISDRTDIPDLMKVIDILVFPSFSEGMPVSLIEAQIAGVKCLVSKEAISKEIEISNLIRYKSLEEPASIWADEVLRWEEEKIEYVRVDDWDMEKVIENLENLYYKAVETNKSNEKANN